MNYLLPFTKLKTMKLNTFSKFNYSSCSTNQHQFNGIAERAIRTLKDKAIQNYETAFKYLDQESKQDSIKKWWFWSMHYADDIEYLR